LGPELRKKWAWTANNSGPRKSGPEWLGPELLGLNVIHPFVYLLVLFGIRGRFKNEFKHRNSCIFKNLSIIIKSCKILTVLKENLINTIPCQYSEFVLAEVHTKAASCRKRTLFRSRTASLIAQSILIGWLFRPG
jgi:hypothetical protein